MGERLQNLARPAGRVSHPGTAPAAQHIQSRGISAGRRMSNPLRTPADYEFFVYSLQELFPTIRRSTVRLVRRGASLARIVGEFHFDQNVRLVVRERIVYHRLPAVIDEYGYEVWQGNEKLYWYDSQPHPNDPD